MYEVLTEGSARPWQHKSRTTHTDCDLRKRSTLQPDVRPAAMPAAISSCVFSGMLFVPMITTTTFGDRCQAIHNNLHICVYNNTPNVIPDFRLYVTDIRLYSEKHEAFIEVPAMHSRGPFKKLELVGTPPTDIFPGHPGLRPFLSIEESGHTQLLLTFRGRTEDASMETRAIDQGDCGALISRSQLLPRPDVPR
jgi:hypothetical protein